MLLLCLPPLPPNRPTDPTHPIPHPPTHNRYFTDPSIMPLLPKWIADRVVPHAQSAEFGKAFVHLSRFFRGNNAAGAGAAAAAGGGGSRG